MPMTEILKISNSWPLWALCGILVVWVAIQSVLYVKLCRKEADHLNYPQKKLNTAIVNGMVAAVGPGLAGVVVMISMMAVIGGPITWQRLSIIGAAQTELTAAKIASQAMGVDTLGGPGFTLETLALCFFVMAFNGCGWLLMTAVCTSRMETVRMKLSGGDTLWLGLLSAGATIGLFANFAAQSLIRGKGPMTAVLVGFGVQFFIDKVVAPMAPWIKGYSIAISLFCAMFVGQLVAPIAV